jgi:hypothetical protein
MPAALWSVSMPASYVDHGGDSVVGQPREIVRIKLVTVFGACDVVVYEERFRVRDTPRLLDSASVTFGDSCEESTRASLLHLYFHPTTEGYWSYRLDQRAECGLLSGRASTAPTKRREPHDI